MANVKNQRQTQFTVLEMYFWNTICAQVQLPQSSYPLSYLYEFTNKKMEVYTQQMKNDVVSHGFCPGNIIFT